MRKTIFFRRSRLAAILVGVLTACAFAEVLTIQGDHVDVLKGKGSLYYPPLGMLKRGDSLNVTAREGRWLVVDYNGQTAYVLASAVSGEEAAEANKNGSGSGTTEATAAAAAKGWDSVAWAGGHGYKLDGLNTMMATRQQLQANIGGFEQFKSDGHVGAH